MVLFIVTQNGHAGEGEGVLRFAHRLGLFMFVNEFSWSYSRDRTFRSCLRRYWLNYYGSWGGWERSAAPEVQDLYRQKKLTTRPMWMGTLIHEAAERSLKTLTWAQPWGVENALAWIDDRARQDVVGSREGTDRRRPSKRVEFQEHYYDVEDVSEDWEDNFQEMARQVHGLFENPVFVRLTRVPQRIRMVEDLIKVDLEGIGVWVSMDALVEDGRGGVVIIDWKTGKSHSDEEVGRQLGIYGLYAREKLGLSPERIRALHVNLRDGTYKTHPISQPQLEQSATDLRASAAEMRDRLRDSAANEGDMEDFPMLEKGDSTCFHCQFRRSCGREG
ncbi:MAG: PD-(D/E)XK nuclease family protein [Myxococcota bacterium]|nr:PD-(D/E)XK nuclease family protein [Myxococcota bacterium]